LNKIIYIAKMMHIFGSKGGRDCIRDELMRRLKSHEIYYCLRRDLSEPFEAPQARIPITIRPLQEEDIPILLDLDNPELNGESIKERIRRLMFINKNVSTCFVAVTDEGIPCYMQWLMGAKNNKEIQAFFNGGFPVLQPDEMLLEYAFSHENFRGKRVMSYAMAQIAEKGLDSGANSVITFVNVENIPSLKGCKKAGFYPYSLREDIWRLFRRARKFTMLPPNTPYPFDR